MGQTKGRYKIEFPNGSKVRIADLQFLEEFQRTWKYHHPLQPEQLDYHDKVATVEAGAFYHGGDEIYKLAGIPGIWHEECLSSWTDPEVNP